MDIEGAVPVERPKWNKCGNEKSESARGEILHEWDSAVTSGEVVGVSICA